MAFEGDLNLSEAARGGAWGGVVAGGVNIIVAFVLGPLYVGDGMDRFEITIPMVFLETVVPAVSAAVLLEFLETRFEAGLRAFFTAAFAVFALSIVPVLTMAHDLESTVGLALIHVTAAAGAVVGALRPWQRR